MQTPCHSTAARLAGACLLLMPAIALAGQGPAASTSPTLPDAPMAQATQSSTSASGDPSTNTTTRTTTTSTTVTVSNEGRQTKRILGIVPNFRAVSANVKLPPDTPKDKFKTAFQDSFDYSAIIWAGGQAGVGQLQSSYPAFGQGAAGYGRYFWHTFADQTDENLWVEGILPVALKQDNRYYTLGHGGFVKRCVYSFSRIAITRNDAGDEVPNYSEIVGAGTASGIAALYYPGQYRTWTKVGQRWLTSVIIDGFTFSAKEFWPDVNNAIFHQKD
jgi:hypothetical protein